MTACYKRLLGAELRVVNVGLDLFASTLEELGVPAVHMDWRPPAGGDPRLAQLLDRLKSAVPRPDSPGGQGG